MIVMSGSIFFGRYSGHGFEHTGKMKFIGKSGGFSNLVYFHASVHKQFLCLVDPDDLQIFKNGKAEIFFEDSVDIIKVHFK